MKLVKIAVKLFLVWMTIFCMASWIHADELSAIKDGYNSYWSNIKDGKGGCTVTYERFTPENQANLQNENIKSYAWTFAGSKIRYKMVFISMKVDGQKARPSRAESANEIYFDGQKVTQGSEKNFVLRKLNISDISQTNQWDPRLVTTGSIRSGESWEPVPFWREGNSKIVGKEKINGYECSVLETTSNKYGMQMVIRSWFDIERNYCLVRSETWGSVGKDTVIPPGLEWIRDSGKLLSDRRDIELKKYGKNLWGPKKCEWVNYGPNLKAKTFYIAQKVTTTYDDACAYNLGLSENDLKIILLPGVTVSDASKYSTDYVKPKVSIEFRTTKNISSPDFAPVNTSDTNEKVYISNKAEITEADVSGVKISFGMQGLPSLDILLTETGADKLAELTQNHLNERMAIFVDGKLFSIPVIKDKIRGPKMQLSGNLTETEIKRIIGAEAK